MSWCDVKVCPAQTTGASPLILHCSHTRVSTGENTLTSSSQSFHFNRNLYYVKNESAVVPVLSAHMSLVWDPSSEHPPNRNICSPTTANEWPYLQKRGRRRRQMLSLSLRKRNTADKAAVLHRCPTFPTLIICSFICCSTHSFTVKSTVRAVFTSLKAELL